MVQSPLMFAPQRRRQLVYYSSSAYPKQDMFLLLNPRGEDDFTKTHLQCSSCIVKSYQTRTTLKTLGSNLLSLRDASLNEKEKIVSSSSSAYLKQDMFLLLNPRGEDDFTKTHLQCSSCIVKSYQTRTTLKTLGSNLLSLRDASLNGSLAVSSDDRYLATRGVDRHAFTGHRNTISSLLFRHRTAELYSGSFDRSVKECTYGWER
ncbi:hypothetical protein DY000_02007154 [Brassica cretica]|uniref:Uncharacterized protein n=1 Tax=Brassica cretica TaxID=69181 RepID=A0ABQ7BY15_BRACR|nr:hypothetical protein DY000_02007154 [Brassica cretica]